MRVADLQRGREFEPELLGIRHSIGRWIASESSRLPQQITVQNFAITGSGYENNPNIPKLPWVKDELEWLIQHYNPIVIPLKSGDLVKFLDTGTAQAVHFACHGKMSFLTPLLSLLIMEDHPANLKPTTISRFEVQKGLGANHPIVFLNACQTGAEGYTLGLVAGFPAAFLKAGASAVISPLWTISDAHAKEITEQFYSAAFAQPGATLGEIMQNIRKEWAAKNHLTFLAYVLYGDPQARIKFDNYYADPQARIKFDNYYADRLPEACASDWGRDEYGFWMGFTYQGVRQLFRWIEPGSFMLGSPQTEPERLEDEILHVVTLSQGFWLADSAVTQALWQAVMGENPSYFIGANCPVDNVSWEDAQAFIVIMNRMIPGLNLRLPTEAQWEYACRAGTSLLHFVSGEQITSESVNFNGTKPYNNGKPSECRNTTVDVKTLPHNFWGLYEMHGNVWEWCSDWYGDYSSQPVIDPQGLESGCQRVLRGGSWSSNGSVCRSASRGYSAPDYRHNSIGFRLAQR